MSKCNASVAGRGARPVHLIITMIQWIRTSRLSIKNSLSTRARPVGRGSAAGPPPPHPPYKSCNNCQQFCSNYRKISSNHQQVIISKLKVIISNYVVKISKCVVMFSECLVIEMRDGQVLSRGARKVDVRLPGKGNSKLLWREAGPLDHLDGIVDSDQ